MKAFRRHTGRVAVLDRPDVDTDQIIPKQFLKRIERTGYGEFLFYDWARNPSFELLRPQYEGASILIAGRNFGCGSSREHAAWALQGAGYGVVIASSFGDIFRSNAGKNGLLAIALPEAELARLKSSRELTVDLERQVVVSEDGREVAFELDGATRHRLLHGLDDIGITLRCEDAIADYERAHAAPVNTTAAAT